MTHHCFCFPTCLWKVWMFFVQLCCNTKICVNFMIVMESKINDNQTPAEVNNWVTWTSRIFQLWWPSNRLQFHPEEPGVGNECLGDLWRVCLDCCFPVFPKKWRSPKNMIWYGGCLWCVADDFFQTGTSWALCHLAARLYLVYGNHQSHGRKYVYIYIIYKYKYTDVYIYMYLFNLCKK